MSESQSCPDSKLNGELQGPRGVFGTGDHGLTALGKYNLLYSTNKFQEEDYHGRL
jgi:hypothetical protein